MTLARAGSIAHASNALVRFRNCRRFGRCGLLPLVIAVDELCHRVYVLLWHWTTDGYRGQMSLSWKNDVLENPCFSPDAHRLGVRTVECAVDRQNRNREFSQID